MKAFFNKLWDIIRLGLHDLGAHKVRSGLTVLGILFGVWSVIAMLAINEGGSYEAQRALRRLGSNNIIVSSVKPPAESGASAQSSGILEYGLQNKDVARLRDTIPGVVRCVVVRRTQRYASEAGRSLAVTVIGTEPAYARIAQTDMVGGRFITGADYLRARPVCVLTASLARRLLVYRDPLGATIWLGSEPFAVVGIIRQLPLALSGGASDVENYVVVPMTADLARFGEMNIMVSAGSETYEKVAVSQCILQMADEQAVIDGATVARSLLERQHPKQDYEVTVPLEIIEQIKQQRRLWNFMFLVIASVSLLVGGIGIMNIMLASVTERTREIGIRRALGAKRRDITVQFLIEAVALTTVGGLLGIFVGMLVPWAVERLLKFTTILVASTLVLPFVMAVVVGLVSGLYPALRAARLDPIEALRHE
jgi:putative ABC transport system permease protein